MNTTIIAGAGIGVLVTLWGHLKTFFGYFRNMFILTVNTQIEYDTGRGLSSLLREKRTFRLGDLYMGVGYITGSDRKEYVIGAESMTTAGPVLFFNPFPVIMQRDSMYQGRYKFVFLRGTFNIRKFLETCMNKGMEQEDHVFTRFDISHVWGSIKVDPMRNHEVPSPEAGVKEASSDGEKYPYMTYRNVHSGAIKHIFGNVSAMGFIDYKKESRKFLENLYLTPEQQFLLDEIGHFLSSKQWYESHTIPWKRGILLTGPPGTGKSSMVYAIARCNDIPVRVFHLDTMTNQDLVNNWHGSSAGVINVIEDIDAVFDHRENLNKSSMHPTLTFDCLLNVLDGVSHSQGVITIITTNYPEKLDPALSGARPGRIDRTIRCGYLLDDGKKFIMRRILDGLSECEMNHFFQEHLSGDPMSGAAIQELCIQYALKRYWDDEGEAQESLILQRAQEDK